MTNEEAIKELEQIPIKPSDIRQTTDMKFGLCRCGEWVKDDMQYCSACGQKLDWRSDKE